MFMNVNLDDRPLAWKNLEFLYKWNLEGFGVNLGEKLNLKN
jgi:hypothetical protein